jgi:hypothetical protein
MKTPVKKESEKLPTAMEPNGRSSEPSEEDIRLLAYAIYEAKGSNPGHDLDDWLQAERELARETEQSRL